MVQTITTIDGERVTLDQGVRYIVRPRSGDDIVATFEGRQKNGTLVFLGTLASGAGRINLRPKDVLAITDAAGIDEAQRMVESANGRPFAEVEADERAMDEDDDLPVERIASTRLPNETATAFLGRVERTFPRNYVAFTATDAGQALLREAGREADEARRKPGRYAAGKEATAKVLSDQPFEDNPDGDPAKTARNRARLRVVATEALEERAERYCDGLGRGRCGREMPHAAHYVEPEPKRGPKPYAERNQVWRCGTCKKRTRAASCTNGHPEVTAPHGKRAADRTA